MARSASRKGRDTLSDTMDHLWSPWRYAYVSTAEKASGCIFCDALNNGDDRKVWIVHRGTHCFIMLNAFPYTSGHVMIVPYVHVDELQKLDPAVATEMMALTQKMEGIQRELYSPHGINLGMNIGAAAGAGVAGHIHMHVLPRWVADASFITTICDTRVIPEALEQTYDRMKPYFGR
jgi:ATP adenylyltransferase